jgi:hypothetical protein
MSLALADLHEIYATAEPAEARLIANLGAEVYVAVRDQLRAAWSADLSAEEGAKADVWRAEGRVSAMEEVRGRLTVGEAAAARVAVLQATVDAEVARRTEEVLAVHRKEVELAAREEIHALETQLAELRGNMKMMKMVEEAHTSMREQIDSLQAEVAKYQAATSTKSSHALGKIGEAFVLDMLNLYVLPRFPYAEVRDMTAIKHAGDFHLWVFGPTGKRVKIMLDVKKYTNPVQNVEVEKLYSDLDGDDAEVGVMVSLDSAISNKSQFQIVRTKKNKPCMFLTFDKLDDGIRQEVLCWAIRVLVSVASANDSASQDEMMAEIQSFLVDMNASVGELDTCMKSAKGLYEMLRDMKERLVKRIAAFKGVDDIPPSTAAVVYAADDDMRCKGLNASGTQCKARRIPEGNLCARHESMATAGRVVTLVK